MRSCRNRAFTFLELLIAILFLSVALLSLFHTVSFSNRESMDASFEFTAMSLAREPLEVFRGFGYEWLSKYADHPLAQFPEGWADIAKIDPDAISYPVDALQFKRWISLSPFVDGGTRGIRVKTVVSPVRPGKAFSWLSRSQIELESAVFEEKPR